MKKLLTLTAVAMAVSMTPALAEDHEGKGHKGGKMFEKHDTNGDGVVSKDEFLAHVEEKFSKMDKDGNGELSKEEAQAGHAAMREKMKEKRQEHREERKEKRDAASETSDE